MSNQSYEQKKKTIRKELTDLVEKIKSHSDRVSEMDHVPILEIEVLMSYAHKLLEKATLYKYFLTDEILQYLPEISPVRELTNTAGEDKPSLHMSTNESATEETKEKSGKGTSTVISEEKIQKKSSGENFSGTEQTYITVADRLGKKHRQPLYKTMSIAEKYYFASLFNRDLQLLQEVMNKIDQSDAFDEAIDILMQNIRSMQQLNEEEKVCFDQLKKKIENKFLE